MKVSVIIPVFNSSKYLSDCINSVLNQTYNNLEIIIVDDHSTDHSLELIKSYTDPRISIYINDKKGACSARNYGFRVSTGDYIQFLDSDDVLDLDKINCQIKSIMDDDIDVLFSGKWGRFYGSIDNVVWANQEINKNYSNPINWLIDSWGGKGMGTTNMWLIPRSIIRKSGLWNEGLKINQDGEFFSRVILNSTSIRYCNDSVSYYRSGQVNSITSVLTRNKIESLLESYLLYEQNIINRAYNSEIKKGLARNFMLFAYQFFHLEKLRDKSLSRYKALGVVVNPNFGGFVFKIISYIFGFSNSLKLRGFIQSKLRSSLKYGVKE